MITWFEWSTTVNIPLISSNYFYNSILTLSYSLSVMWNWFYFVHLFVLVKHWSLGRTLNCSFSSSAVQGSGVVFKNVEVTLHKEGNTFGFVIRGECLCRLPHIRVQMSLSPPHQCTFIHIYIKQKETIFLWRFVLLPLSPVKRDIPAFSHASNAQFPNIYQAVF